MALTKVQTIGIETGISLTGVTTVTTLNASTDTLSVGGTVNFGGNVSIAGTLTYEDVTNIDAVGLITARSGINVTSGRVLVNTTTVLESSSAAKLHIAHTSGASIALGRDDSSVAADNDMGKIAFYGNDGGSYEKVAQITCEADKSHASGDKPGRLLFATTADGASSPTERLRIASDGKITTSYQIVNDTAPDFSFEITQVDPSNTVNQLGGSGVGLVFKPATNSAAAVGAGIAAIKPGGSDTDTTSDLAFYVSQNDETLDEKLRITSEGHKWTVIGSLFHGSGDYSDFIDASRNSYNNVSVRAGYAGGDSTPTNRTSAIKIYPAGTRNNAVGTLTGGVAWQHLDINNGSWGSSYGDGAQIWMGAAIHDVPGQERDRFNLWMNSSTVAGSNPNNLAIEAYPNGMVRHPKVPAFHAKGGTSLTNNTNVIIVSSSTEFNNGSCYSTSNGRFTAPIDGIYYFSFWGLLYPHASGVINIFYFRNGTQYGHLVQGGADSNNHTSRAGSIMMSMSAGDYAELRINRGSNTGVNAYGSQWNMCGFLVG